MKRAISKSGAVTALGAMSGTSLDGIDAAVVVTDGHRILGFGPFCYEAYSSEDQRILKTALGHWDGPFVEAATDLIERRHLDVLKRFDLIDLVGFHGQTLAHAPREKGTLQIGNGAALSTALGIPVAWDFRTTDVEFGGEGAPLAPFFHFACAKFIGAAEPLAFLNLGGVGNLTYVDPAFEYPEMPEALLAFDTGPANAPVNDLVQSRLGIPFDKDGRLARKGQVRTDIIERFLSDPYFSRPPPKSLDRNDFAQMTELVRNLGDEDAAATLTAMCVASVVAGMRHCPTPPGQLLVTGGGRHNPVLMEMLGNGLDCPIHPVEKVGLDGDMLEAQAFAFLAVRVARGLTTSCPATTGVSAAIGGGTVSTPATPENVKNSVI